MTLQMKRLASPKMYRIKRKGFKWISKPASGTHSKNKSITVSVALRDMLNITKNATETKKLLNKGLVLVDQVKRKNNKFPLGFMDVLSIPSDKKYYRVVYDNKGRISLIPIPEKESKTKICMVIKKQLVRSKVQIGLHDGRTILLNKTDGNKYSTEDSLIISLPDQKIMKKLPFKKEMYVMTIGGNHIGELSVIKDFKKFTGPQPNRVILKSGSETYETLEDYAFVIGEKGSEVTVK